MIFLLGLAAVGIIGMTGYIIHSWVSEHALAVAMDGRWMVQAEGWASLWILLVVGLLAGAVMGLSLGVAASGRIAEALSAAHEDSFEQARTQLQQERARLEEKIRKSTEKAYDASRIYNEKFQQERDKSLLLERKIKSMEGRMKGAQQKATRIKKVLLKSL